MTRRGETLLGRVADGEERDEIIVRHCGECFLQLRCVEVSDPCRAEALVVDGEHDVRRDDGGVDIGEVAFIIGAHPCFICFSSDDKKDAGTEGIEFVASASFARASGLWIAQTLNGCLLTAVGARRAASKMRPKTSCGISRSESARQEKRSRMSSLNSIILPPSFTHSLLILVYHIWQEEYVSAEREITDMKFILPVIP